MVEMIIGSRFYYKDKLCEVVKDSSNFKCIRCVIYGDRRNCEKAKCFAGNRHDCQSVFFRELEAELPEPYNPEENNNESR